jgi:hypothetical protein
MTTKTYTPSEVRTLHRTSAQKGVDGFASRRLHVSRPRRCMCGTHQEDVSTDLVAPTSNSRSERGEYGRSRSALARVLRRSVLHAHRIVFFWQKVSIGEMSAPPPMTLLRWPPLVFEARCQMSNHLNMDGRVYETQPISLTSS